MMTVLSWSMMRQRAPGCQLCATSRLTEDDCIHVFLQLDDLISRQQAAYAVQGVDENVSRNSSSITRGTYMM